MGQLSRNEIGAIQALAQHQVGRRETARLLDVDESTVRYHLRRATNGHEDGRKKQPEACGAYAEFISEWLAGERTRAEELGSERPPNLKALYEDLVTQKQYSGSYKAVVRYVRRRTAPVKVRPHRRVEVRPGSQAQVDWTPVPLEIAELDGLIVLQAFVLVLSFSRMWTVVWKRGQDMLNWLDAHNQAFLDVEGVPLTVRHDNTKTAVAQGAGSRGKIHPVYASYAHQLGFLTDACEAYCAERKGKVERRARDLQRLQVRHGEAFASLEHLSAACRERRLARAQSLVNPLTGRSIYDSWRQEVPTLKTLPASLPTPFDTTVRREVDASSLVCFEGRQYQVPFLQTGRIVEVRGCAEAVEIYSGRDLVATYPRRTDCRILLDQRLYDGEGDERVARPVPLGKVGREIALERSWEAPVRSLDTYIDLVRRLG